MFVETDTFLAKITGLFFSLHLIVLFVLLLFEFISHFSHFISRELPLRVSERGRGRERTLAQFSSADNSYTICSLLYKWIEYAIYLFLFRVERKVVKNTLE